jgi:hypothetical protein
MNINNIIENNGIIFDRYLGTPLELPYSNFDEIKIKQNDTVTNFNINNIISKLYDNYLYLYKMSHIASNLMPLTSIATAGVFNNIFSYYRNLSTSQFTSLTSGNITNLDNCNALSVQYNADLDQYAIFASSGPSLVVFNSDTTFTSIVTALSTNTIFDGSTIKWGKIQDFAFGDNTSLYVLDLSANSVIKYNAAGFVTDDNILGNTLTYETRIGGYGGFDDTTKFNSPESITYYNSELYVLDSGNSCIKKYDKNLNWLTTYRLFRDFLSAYPIQINHDSSGSPYVVTNANIVYKYNGDFTDKTVIDIDLLTGDKGAVKRIVFSPSDSNVFYLYTDKNVYKSLLSNPDDIVGKYLFNLFKVNTDETIRTVSSIAKSDSTGSYDYNFIFSSANNVGKISIYKDNINIVSLLTDREFDVYDLNEIKINSEEYIQNWVINKAISKLLINHMRLRDEIASKFLFKKDPASGDTLFVGERYLLPGEFSSIRFQQDLTNYIGMNEIFQNNIINRPFEIIHNIQTNILSVIAAEVENFYDKTRIINLS